MVLPRQVSAIGKDVDRPERPKPAPGDADRGRVGRHVGGSLAHHSVNELMNSGALLAGLLSGERSLREERPDCCTRVEIHSGIWAGGVAALRSWPDVADSCELVVHNHRASAATTPLLQRHSRPHFSANRFL